MPSFNFRLRFNLPETFRIQADESALTLMTLSSGQEVVLKSGGRNAPIKDFPRAAVVGRGFASEAAAREARGESEASTSLLYG
jgi:hypothetical protein